MKIGHGSKDHFKGDSASGLAETYPALCHGKLSSSECVSLDLESFIHQNVDATALSIRLATMVRPDYS
jgi:hypothetical protein